MPGAVLRVDIGPLFGLTPGAVLGADVSLVLGSSIGMDVGLLLGALQVALVEQCLGPVNSMSVGTVLGLELEGCVRSEERESKGQQRVPGEVLCGCKPDTRFELGVRACSFPLVQKFAQKMNGDVHSLLEQIGAQSQNSKMMSKAEEVCCLQSQFLWSARHFRKSDKQ